MRQPAVTVAAVVSRLRGGWLRDDRKKKPAAPARRLPLSSHAWAKTLVEMGRTERLDLDRSINRGCRSDQGEHRGVRRPRGLDHTPDG